MGVPSAFLNVVVRVKVWLTLTLERPVRVSVGGEHGVAVGIGVGVGTAASRGGVVEGGEEDEAEVDGSSQSRADLYSKKLAARWLLGWQPPRSSLLY